MAILELVVIVACACGSSPPAQAPTTTTAIGSLGDTWAWDGTSWRKASTSGPTPRYLPAMAYDEKLGVFVLFGGETKHGSSDETWTWDGKTWKLQSPVHHPLLRRGAAMAYDPSHRVVVLFGGAVTVGGVGEGFIYGADTWTWDGADWTEVDAGPGIAERRDGPRMVTAGDHALMFGGHLGDAAFFANALTWDGSGWKPADRPPRPPGRGSPTLAWMPSDGSLFVFSGTGYDPNAGPGTNGKPLADAWSLRDGAWSQLSAAGPGALPYSNAFWDAKLGAVVVMLGLSCPNPSGAVWSWNGSSWSKQPPLGIPARWGAASAQAPDGHALLFGGSNEPGC